jgi:hypothetical protein
MHHFQAFQIKKIYRPFNKESRMHHFDAEAGAVPHFEKKNRPKTYWCALNI